MNTYQPEKISTKTKNKRSILDIYVLFYYPVFKFFKTIITILLVVFILFEGVYLLVNALSQTHKLWAVSSDSMKPLLTRGDMVLTEKQSEYKVGDIIAFDMNKEVFLHRISRLDLAKAGPSKTSETASSSSATTIANITTEIPAGYNTNLVRYYTKGDANNVEDGRSIELSAIHGKMIFYAPQIGHPLLWLNSVAGVIIALIIPVSMILALNLKDINDSFERRYRELKEKDKKN